MTKICRQIIDFLGCECEVFEQAEEAYLMGQYERLIVEGRQKGYIPLIIIPSDTLGEMFSLTLDDFGVSDTSEGIAAYRKQALQAAAQLDVSAYLGKRMEEMFQMHEAYDILGAFRQAEPNHDFYSHRAGSKLCEELIIAKFP